MKNPTPKTTQQTKSHDSEQIKRCQGGITKCSICHDLVDPSDVSCDQYGCPY